jgi:ankyrin repeat protein
VSCDHYNIVTFLVEKGADVECEDSMQNTPLMTAAWSSGGFATSTSVIKLLLDNGANIESKNNTGETALLAAARSGHETALRFLMDHGADINTRGRYLGGMALFWVARKGNMSLSKFLLDNGADPALLDVRYYTIWDNLNDKLRGEILEDENHCLRVLMTQEHILHPLGFDDAWHRRMKLRWLGYTEEELEKETTARCTRLKA